MWTFLFPERDGTDYEVHVAVAGTEARDAYRELATQADGLWAALTKHRELLAWQLIGPSEFGVLNDQMEELTELFKDCANTEPSAPRWRDSAARALRISRAEVLSPIFELSFEAVPANWPDSNGGPWPDFYQAETKEAVQFLNEISRLIGDGA